LRGRQTLPLPVPALGLVANAPPDQVPANALIDGSNCFLDIDGYFKPRFGYSQFLVAGQVAPPTPPIVVVDVAPSVGFSFTGDSTVSGVPVLPLTLTLTIPPGLANGTLLLALISVKGINPAAGAGMQPILVPSGWSLYTTRFGIAFDTVNVLFHITNGTEGSSVTFQYNLAAAAAPSPPPTAQFTGFQMNGALFSISGANPLAPIDAFLFAPGSTVGTSVGNPGVTTNFSNDLVLILMQPVNDGANSGGAGQITPGNIVGATPQVNQQSPAGALTDTLAIWSQAFANPGATGVFTSPTGWSAGDYDTLALAIAAAPSSNVAPPSSPLNGPVLGILWYTDTDGSTVYVEATTTDIFAVVDDEWARVTGTQLTGLPVDPVRIVDMFFAGAISALFANNHDPIQQWQQGFATAVPLTPINPTLGTSAYTASTVPSFTGYPVGTQLFFTFGNTNVDPSTSITGIGISGNNVTFTVSSAAGFYVGQGINVSGVDPDNFNGLFIITVISGNEITVVQIGASGSYSSGGIMLGGATINVNDVGIVPIRIYLNGILSEIPSGYLIPGTVYDLSFDGTEFVIGTNLLAPTARDIAVVGGRLVAINILQGNFRSPSLVVWTAAFDPTTWPAQAYDTLVDTDDPLIAIRLIGQAAAVVYGEESAWLCQGVPGAADANAFNFTPIRGVVVGPVSSAAVVIAEGLHYYLARDGRIWTCDGNSATPISAPIDPILIGDIDSSSWTESHAVYYPKYRQIWFFYPSKASGIAGPSRAIVYSIARGVFEPVQIFVEAITASALAAFVTSTTWNQLTEPWTFYQVPWNSFATQSQISVLLGAEDGSVYDFSEASTTDNNVAIPYGFTPGLLNIDAVTDMLMNSFELFFDPASSFELLVVAIYGLQYPQDPGVVDTAFPLDLSAPDTWRLPQSLPTITTYRRYYSLEISGITINRGMAYGGGNMFENVQDRASQ